MKPGAAHQRQLMKNGVHSVFRRITREARDILEQAIVDAPAINDDGVDVETGSTPEWTKKRLQAAMDLRKPKRNMPGWAELALDRVDSAEKAAALRAQPKVSLNLGALVQVVEAKQYDVVALPAHKE